MPEAERGMAASSGTRDAAFPPPPSASMSEYIYIYMSYLARGDSALAVEERGEARPVADEALRSLSRARSALVHAWGSSR